MLRSLCSRLRWMIIVSTAVYCIAPLALADECFLHDGDIVVMIGDSITEQHLYSNYVEMWRMPIITTRCFAALSFRRSPSRTGST